MNFHRTLALLLTLCCLLTALPVTPVQAVSHSELFDLIAGQYDAYAASIAQPNAADDTVEQLLNHALYGKHKALDLGPSDTLTACAFGSVLFREAMIDSVAYALETLHNNKEDQALMLFSLNWYTHKKTYGIRELHLNTTADYEDDLIKHDLCSVTVSTPLNRNDEAMILVVGGATGRLWLDRDAADPDLYHVRIAFFDRFDFNKSLTSSMKAFNGSLASLLNILGPLMGFKSFDWHATVSFDVRLPQLCSHETGNHRWETSADGLVPCSGEGLTENPLQQHLTPSGTDYYYELTQPVYLRHEDPWSLEFRYKSSKPLYLGPQSNNKFNGPYFLRRADNFFVGQAFPNHPEDGTDASQTRYHYGLSTESFAYRDWHTFRIENRIEDNGTNRLWLLIDGQELGPLADLYIQDAEGNEVSQSTETDWASGRDFIIRYIGSRSYPLRGELESLSICQNAQPITAETAEATCTAPGFTRETCSLCGLVTKQENTPALGHDLKTVAGQAPTCEAPGYTDSQVCARCWETVTATQTLPAFGHSPAAVPGKEPLCQAEGLSEGSVCSVCAKTLTPQQSIPALGHSYENGLCTRCAQQDPTLIPGDANGDGMANYQDALTVLRVSIGLEPMQPVYLLLCDLDGNGTLNYADALQILRHSIGLGNS